MTRGMHVTSKILYLGLPLACLSLAGCDYWPPALLTQLEQLRVHVQDLSDERAELEARLHEAMVSQENLQRQLEDLTRQNETLRHSITKLKEPPPPDTSAPRLAKSSSQKRSHRKIASSRLNRVLHYTRPLMKGKDVRKVQRALRKAGIPVGLDGIYGRGTRAAVKWYQRKHRLRADGAVGPSTFTHLTTHVGSKTNRKIVRFKRPLMKGPQVKKIQRALREAGVSVRVDGTYGTRTRSAVKQFQRAKGLRADGVVGPATSRALGLS